MSKKGGKSEVYIINLIVDIRTQIKVRIIVQLNIYTKQYYRAKLEYVHLFAANELSCDKSVR